MLFLILFNHGRLATSTAQAQTHCLPRTPFFMVLDIEKWPWGSQELQRDPALLLPLTACRDSSPCCGFPAAFGHNAPLFFPNGRFASWCLATLFFFFFLGLALLLFHHIRCDSVCLMYTCVFSGRLFSTWHSVLRIIKDNSVLPLQAFNLFVPDLLPCHVISFIRGMKWVSACAVWEQRGNSDSSSPSPSCTNSCKRIIKGRGMRMEP